MNDNQEKNRLDPIETEPETEIEPSTDRSSHFSAKKAAKLSAFVYLALAITVVIVATVGIFSISYDYEDALEPMSFPEISVGSDYSFPSSLQNPDTSIPDTHVGNEQSGVDAEVSQLEDESSDSEPERVLFYRPVTGEVVKHYSMDALVFSETMGDYRVHTGIDVACEAGCEVVAFTDGTVSAVNDDYFYGTTVAVTHSQGLVSYYMNLDPELASGIAVGSEVKAGDVLGRVGDTARIEEKDGAHLHFELRVNGELINPEPELPR